MKTTHMLKNLLLLMAGMLALASLPAAQAESLSISTTLILGSKDGGGTDGQLRQYEGNLKRHFPFDTFKQLSSGTARLEAPGSSSVSLSGGHNIAYNVSPAGDGKYRISARWTKGNTTYINTTVVASKNRPTALAGPAQGGGTLILLFVPK